MCSNPNSLRGGEVDFLRFGKASSEAEVIS
jgi:hypothetical protein